MCGPGRLIGEEAVRVLGQASDHRTGQGALAHVGQRFGVDDVIAVTCAQQFEEVAAALGTGGAEPGKMGVADLRAEAIDGLVASPGVIRRDPGGAGEPGAEHIASLVEKVVLAGDQQADELSL